LTLGGAGISAMPFSYRAFVPDYLKEASLYSAAASAAFSGVGIGVDFDRLDFGNQTSNLGSEETSLRLAAGAALSRLFQARAPWLDWGVGATWRHVEVHDKPFRPNPPQDGSVSDLDLGTLVVVHKNVEPRVSSWKSASIAFRVGFVLCNVLDHEVDYPARPSEPLGKHLRFALGLDARLGHVERFGDFLQARFAVETLDVLGKLDLPGPQHRQSYGFEALFLECLAIRYGFHDAENYGLEKDSIGFGVGAHTHRFGGQFDFASVPAPGNLQREEQFTVSGWARF
jgi:hypothetical protein